MSSKTVTTETEVYLYMYIIHGVIPDAMPPVAYRRAGRSSVRRKVIKCPHCKKTLLEIDRNTTVQIYRTLKGKRHNPIPGQFFKMCGACKNEVGIVIVTAN